MNLEPLLQPRSIAVIGASEKENSVGRALFSNILNGGFTGHAYPVNTKATTILGVKAYPALKDIEEPVDLAIIAVPAVAVPTVLEDCGKKGIHQAVIISAGYRESGPEGKIRENILIQLADKHKISLIGPNCLGLINTHAGVRLNATFAKRIPKPGNISFLSQSGALGVYALEFASANDIGMARFVSLGNKAVLNENHILENFGSDPDTKVILAYLEDLKAPGIFLERAANIASQPDPKPIVLIKAGTSRSGQRAAVSHTGALGEKTEFLGDLCEQYGVLRVSTLEEMFDIALCLAHQPLPSGPRLAILTNAGGPSILAADEAEKLGLILPELSATLREKLAALLPPSAGLKNPVDVLGDADPERYGKALKALLDSGEVDSIITICTPQMMTRMEDIAQVLADHSPQAQKKGIPLLAAFAHFGTNSTVENIFKDAGIPDYGFAENAVRALSAAAHHALWRLRSRETALTSDLNREAVREILNKAQETKKHALNETECQAVLKAFGLPVVNSIIIHAREDLAQTASMKFPMVLKILSPDILHKFDAGGVISGIRNMEDLEASYDRLLMDVHKAKPDARIEGVLIQEMVTDGLEAIMGAIRDPHFGPLILFGLGGTYVEAIHDVKFRRAPLKPVDAEEMIQGLRASALLGPFRNRPARDIAALKDCLLGLSQLMIDFPEIAEIDLNPVFALEHGAKIADVRILLEAA